MTRPRLLSLTASVGLHLVTVGSVLWIFGGERPEPVLFIDLTGAPAVRVGGESQREDSGAGSGPRGTATPPRRETRRSASATGGDRSASPPPDLPPAVARSDTPPSIRGDPPRPVESPAAARDETLTPRAPAGTDAPVVTAPRDGDSSSRATAADSGRRQASPGPSTDVGRTGADHYGRGAAGADGTGGAAGATGVGPAAGGTGTGHGVDGPGVARATPGTRDGVDLTAYHELLRRHIRDSLAYPAASRRRGLAGTVEVEIFVKADGVIRDVTVVGPSSNATLDKEAVGALKRLPPLAFPPGLPPRALRVRLPVVFDLR